MKRLTMKQFVRYVIAREACGPGVRWLKRQRSPAEAYLRAQTPAKIEWARWLIGELFGHRPAEFGDRCCCTLEAEEIRERFPWKRVAAAILKTGARP